MMGPEEDPIAMVEKESGVPFIRFDVAGLTDLAHAVCSNSVTLIPK